MIFVLGGPGSGKGTYFIINSDNAIYWLKNINLFICRLEIY